MTPEFADSNGVPPPLSSPAAHEEQNDWPLLKESVKLTECVMSGMAGPLIEGKTLHRWPAISIGKQFTTKDVGTVEHEMVD